MLAINLSGSLPSPSLYARKLWQQLFNIYLERGGQTSHLDSFLCDLYSFEKEFKAGWNEPMCWGASLNSNFTILLSADYRTTMMVDLQVIITRTKNTIELEVQ